MSTRQPFKVGHHVTVTDDDADDRTIYVITWINKNNRDCRIREIGIVNGRPHKEHVFDTSLLSRAPVLPNLESMLNNFFGRRVA